MNQASSHLSFYQLLRLFGIWLMAQSVALLGLSFLLPNYIVLGTNIITPFSASFNSMFVLTLLAVGALPLLELFQDYQKEAFGTSFWIMIYFVINSAGFWIISRFAEFLGLGLSSWPVAVILGLVMSFVQGFFAVRYGKSE
jgi:hypothetical protein